MTIQPTRAIVKETGESAYAVEIAVSGYHINGDEPLEAGGGSLGPAPYDFLTAALGECTAMTVRWFALQQQWPLEKVSVTIIHHKEGKQDVFTKEVTLVGEALTKAQSQKLLEIATKCPVQRTLEGNPSIETKLK